MNTVEKIVSICKDRKIPIYKIEKDCGFSNGYLRQLKRGTVPADRLVTISNYLNVSIESLINDDVMPYTNVFNIEPKSFPILGKVACGMPKMAVEEHDCYVMSDNDTNADFCVIANGDSMVGARIHDGDIVFVKKQDIVNNGEIAVVIVNSDNEATLKRFFYYPDKSMLILKAENSKYEDLIFMGDELNNVRVIGRAVSFQSYL